MESKTYTIGKSINPNYNIKSFKSKGIKFFGTRDVIQTELPNVEVNFEELFESKIFGGMDLPFRGV